ncbi:MAG: DUF4034 domain-containing protein [Luteolibacter sp.]|uniref:DUF4034 domain-containing protein n=1 Tax=Luteolibacter sp. TaxID=1962973 RepID=UPI00326395B3
MTLRISICLLSILIGAVAGCRERESSSGGTGETADGATENIDQSELEAAKKLKAVVDPVQQEIDAFSATSRKMFDERRFDDLEKLAADLRANKSLFRDGSWKIRQFYVSFERGDDEPDANWKAAGNIHQEWVRARPASITAQVAHANFFVNYAWFVRGSGYAASVSEKENYSFEKRLESAVKILQASRDFPEKDPMWWNVAITTALGQGWSKKAFDQIVEEGVALEPTYHGHDRQRAYSLLPRWYGEPGDWEAYALKAAARKDGLGDELYARIVIDQRHYYDQIFRNSKASWPKTKEGLKQLRAKYPDSLAFINEAALLATMASDQAYAKEMYDLLGDTYLPSVFPKPERFAHYRHWAETGDW